MTDAPRTTGMTPSDKTDAASILIRETLAAVADDCRRVAPDIFAREKPDIVERLRRAADRVERAQTVIRNKGCD